MGPSVGAVTNDDLTSAAAIHPFRIDIPQQDLDDLRARLERTRWPGELPGVGWSYGVAEGCLRELTEHWKAGYDWRAAEARLNEIPQYVTEIDGARVHFVHARSPEPDALPLLITHGWPSTPAEFHRIIGPLTDPRAHGGDPASAFHVVAPTIPGFGFSGPTTEVGWGSVRRVATAWAELMRRLGYDAYGAQGGDFGSMVSPELGRIDTEHVVGVHVNALVDLAPPAEGDWARLTPAETARLGELEERWAQRQGYAAIQSTRPQTLAYAMNDSPAGQLAWTMEWYVDYDPTTTRQTPVDRDDLLTNVSILWLTATFGSSIRLYAEGTDEEWGAVKQRSPVPTGVANFLGDSAVRTLAGKSNTIVRWSEFDSGGHFASLQAPELLVQDVREFFATVR